MAVKLTGFGPGRYRKLRAFANKIKTNVWGGVVGGGVILTADATTSCIKANTFQTVWKCFFFLLLRVVYDTFHCLDSTAV